MQYLWYKRASCRDLLDQLQYHHWRKRLDEVKRGTSARKMARLAAAMARSDAIGNPFMEHTVDILDDCLADMNEQAISRLHSDMQFSLRRMPRSQQSRLFHLVSVAVRCVREFNSERDTPLVQHWRVNEVQHKPEDAAIIVDIIRHPLDTRDLARTDIAWRTDDVVRMAMECHRDRPASGHLDNARLAILSDAIEEAGYPNEAMVRPACAECPDCHGTGDETSDGQGRCWTCCGTGKLRSQDDVAQAREDQHKGCCRLWRRTGECGCMAVAVPHTEGLVEHLRTAGPHYIGCWAVDTVLGLG